MASPGTYGITSEEWCLIYDFQQGRCLICWSPLRDRFRDPKGPGKVAAVDHDHGIARKEKSVRRSVRGLLCAMPCNRLLTRFWTPERLARASQYVKTLPAQALLVLREGEAGDPALMVEASPLVGGGPPTHVEI